MNEKEALALSRRWCSRREYSSRELRDKLHSDTLSEEALERVLAVLREEGFLDDARFTRSFINDKWRFNRWGRKKIDYFLYQKGLKEEWITQAWSAVDEAEYQSMIDSEMKKKAKEMMRLAPFERRAKLLRFGAGRGYEMEIMNHCINEMGL